MKRKLFLMLSAFLVAVSCEDIPMEFTEEFFIVANRGSHNITIFDARTNNKVEDVELPAQDADPTYLVYSLERDRLYVGDFKNKEVVVFDPDDFSVTAQIAIGAGAFHMAINDRIDQLWVNNIVDKTTSVIDVSMNTVIQTIGLPSELSLTAGAVQHDVVISHNGKYAYVTVLDTNQEGTPVSYLVQYDTDDFSYVNSIQFGGDGHLAVSEGRVFALSQNAGEVKELNFETLDEKATISFEGSHGVALTGKRLYVTGLPVKTLGVIHTSTRQVLGSIVTNFNVPHNLAVNEAGDKLFLSHSGPAETHVGFYDISKKDPVPSLILETEAGTNPFGVGYMKRVKIDIPTGSLN